ncbi:MAG: type II secretion system protein [Candidatus Calescibacterium sp.]|nr:type II secretion system GspH family protein [Candidatus Calescibacterium sp.]MCX7972195.1 type II secretion system GspH family protein [bacterium]MDW8194885.1 type II secretion system protein [Candidatus Calescibacterium sp.]
MTRKRKGFTLIELMIVIAIIAVLAAVLVPNFMRAREASRLTACKSNLKNLSTSIETYSNDFNGLYPGGANQGGSFDMSNLGDLSNTHALVQNYIQKRIACPTSRSTDYRYRLVDGSRYWIYCPAVGNNFGGANASPKHRQNNQTGGPVLDSARGILDGLFGGNTNNNNP